MLLRSKVIAQMDPWLQTIQPLDAMESDDAQETGVEAHAFSFF